MIDYEHYLCPVVNSGPDLNVRGKNESNKEEQRIGKIICHHNSNTGRFVKTLLCHINPYVRLKTYALLVYSPKTSELWHASTLQAISYGLVHLFEDSYADIRSETLGYNRKLLIRLHGVLATISKCHEDNTDCAETIQSYKHFTQVFLGFLYEQLSPVVSYQRHITALITFIYVFDTNLGNFLVESKRLALALIRLMFDAFDDVRSVAAKLLGMLLEQSSKDDRGLVTMINSKSQSMSHERSGRIPTIGSQLQKLRLVAEQSTASSTRADQSDGLGRLYASLGSLHHSSDHDTLNPLISSLSDNLLRQGVGKIDLKFPVHGMLLGLK